MELQTAHGQEITPFSNNVFASAVTSGNACGLVETKFDDPDWVMATSDRILRLSLCLASPPCSAQYWYDTPFEPCYADNRFWKFDQDSKIAFAYPLQALGVGSFDSLYVRRSVKLQFFKGVGDGEPYGPELVGPRYVSIDYWKSRACDGFEPDTFFVTGDQGALSDYSLRIGETDANLITSVYVMEDVNDPFRLMPSVWNKFVVRRADTFTIGIKLAMEYSRKCHEIYLEARHNFDGYVTTIEIPEYEYDSSVPDSIWGAKQGASVDHWLYRHVVMGINIPPDAPIGEYEFKVLVRNRGQIISVSEKNFDHEVIVLFNPWSHTDSVYIGDPADRNEYVMNEDGILYQAEKDTNAVTEKKWHFGQFDKEALEVVLNLLVGVTSSVRVDAKLISRHFSNKVNANVLIGKWPLEDEKDPYKDGFVPWYWVGSDQILKKYMEKWEPVKYGQCWVFGGLLTTLLRSVGIPSRPITNYFSGHDADSDGIIDECYIDGKRAYCDEDDEINKRADSWWNYHVWNDVYIDSRWHAVDGTPQELSGGFYQVGPASHNAIKSKIGGDYDAAFVTAEVDAHYRLRFWSLDSGEWKESFNNYPAFIGQLILTKAVGSDNFNDITSSYKTPETNRLLPLTQWVVDVALTAPTEVAAGTDITFDVTLTNIGGSVLRIRIFISTTAKSYDGTFLALIENKEVFADLSPGASLVIPFSVSATSYLDWLRATNIFESIVTVEVEDNDFIAAEFAETVVTFPPPNLDVTPKTSLATKTDGMATFSFVNPLDHSIKNMTVTFSVGRGLTLGGARSVDVFVETLLAGKTLSVTQMFTAVAEGVNLMTVSLSSDMVYGVTASAHIATFSDCNGNGKPDIDDISSGSSQDCNNNDVPDDCELDCNGNGVPDDCDISKDPLLDCNANSIPDACDVSSGFSPDTNNNNSPDECDLDCNKNRTPDDLDIHLGASFDFNQNGIPDECDQDCNANAVSDELDIYDGTSTDTNRNGVPDECENRIADCNKNGIPDSDDIATDSSLDCNLNGVPDECDVGSGLYRDCNTNGIPDECEPDCNKNGIPDDCDVATDTSFDCNSNSVPDECDIATGSSKDRSNNGIPDECELTASPTMKPTKNPTNKPTTKPNKKSTKTNKPTKKPTKKSTKKPTKKSTKKPTKKSTKKPTKKPSKES